MSNYDWKTWFAKTKKYEVYQKQAEEVIEDIKNLGRTYLDVGCGEGRLLEALRKEGKEVVGIDKMYNNLDLVKDPWPKEKFEVVFTSLVAICFDEEQLNLIVNKMRESSSKYLYFYEEFRPEFKCGQLVDEGKWSHRMIRHLGKKPLFQKVSQHNKFWLRQLYEN